MRRAQMLDLPRPPLQGVHDLHRRRARRRPHRPRIRHQATSEPLISAHTQVPRTTKPQVSEPQASWAANPVTSQAELAVKRYNARVTHPVHVVTSLQLEAMAQYDRPVGIGALVTVDTTVPVDVNAVATAVRDCYDR